jgi:dihydrodipicolinate synthase/N-acetylneuraminate lyase
MARLRQENLRGIWAAIPMSWDAENRFDEETYAQNVQRAIAAGVHGIYTTGSTGEFYALTPAEFRRMVDIQDELCGKAGMPLQIGCCSDATWKTLEMLEYVNGKEHVGAAQVNLPYWMELTDREVRQFFRDLYTACPDLPLVHYNIPRAKRFLQGEDYLRILEVAPSLIGVKYTFAGSNFGALQDSILATPQLAYFVGENLLVSGLQIGARGCCSSLVLANPAFVLNMHALAEAGRWEEAIRIQQRVARFFAEAEAFLGERGEGCIDPVFDKGLGVASGGLLGHQRCQAPYLAWSDDTVAAFRDWLRENYPELLYPG